MSDTAIKKAGMQQYSEGAEDGQSFYERVAKSGPCMTVVVNGSDSRIVFANTLFEHYSGYTTAELTGKLFLTMLDDYELDRLQHQFAAVRADPHTCYTFVIYRIHNKEGDVRPFYLYASPMVQNSVAEEQFSLYILPDNSKWGMPFTSYETKELFLEHLHLARLSG